MNMSELPVPQHRFVALGNGHHMHFHEAGTGPTVMFLHGSGPGASGFSNFKGNFPVLAERGFRALVPDSLGFGHSDKPEDVAYTAEFHVDAYRRFLDALGIERLSLIGNSHGGAMALAFALAYPERVERLVLMAPGGLEERDVYVAMPGIRAMMKAFFGPQPMTPEGLRKVFELQLYDKSLITDQTLEERYRSRRTSPSA
jgi:4,5:9,10-diseco-3-hydroxy-5,9,17-trioxoandrosta-1(10),2-diene-4-oate hydrolase